jgi:hypothetical protein
MSDPVIYKPKDIRWLGAVIVWLLIGAPVYHSRPWYVVAGVWIIMISILVFHLTLM